MSFRKENFNCYSFAFYNLENLFDTKDDPKTLDDDFTANSKLHWNEQRFRRKIKKLGRVISSIGNDEIEYPPVVVGVAEIENRYVLEQLVASEFMKSKNYGVAHIDSPDERGIDTALLYRKDHVSILNVQAHTVHVFNEEGIRDYTRDIFHVKANVQEQTVHFLVNHWPSRRRGVEETEFRRMSAAAKAATVVNRIIAEDPAARIVCMGDFNDDPQSKSLQELAGSGFYNPMETLLTNDIGSTIYRGKWFLFDQILVSHNFMQLHGNRFRFEYAKVFNPKRLQEYKGRRKGNPFRTFLGRRYTGGLSDHFPVYAVFTIAK
jgi:predicted extracellular nuclease